MPFLNNALPLTTPSGFPAIGLLPSSYDMTLDIRGLSVEQRGGLTADCTDDFYHRGLAATRSLHAAVEVWQVQPCFIFELSSIYP